MVRWLHQFTTFVLSCGASPVAGASCLHAVVHRLFLAHDEADLGDRPSSRFYTDFVDSVPGTRQLSLKYK